MTKKIILALLLLSFTLTGCYAQNQSADPLVWDFGKVQKNSLLKHVFTVKNEGDAVLNIKDITASCGCTASKIEKKVLAPGESTALEVTFNSRGYSGVVSQFIYLRTDNLDNPAVRYILKAEIEK